MIIYSEIYKLSYKVALLLKNITYKNYFAIRRQCNISDIFNIPL